MEFSADRVAEIAGRPPAKLTRRDVALALLRVPSGDALASLPTLRRGLVAAGNPLSVPFWDSAESILAKIADQKATFGDVHGWLESTGTEPTGIIGLHVWEEPAQRSPLQEEMHTRLVHYLEERVADGEISPDRLAGGDADARRDYVALQERWMSTPLADGRVPMTALLDEQDEQLIADWAQADAEALDALGTVLDAVGSRPVPATALRAASARLRADIAKPGWPGQMLVAFSGHKARTLPADDAQMWLTLAASVASPQGDPLSAEDKEFARALEWADEEDLSDADLGLGADADEPDELSAAMAAVCALDHYDWLAVMSALASGGPGTPASAADLARYVREFDPGEDDAPSGPTGVAGSAEPPDDFDDYDDYADDDYDDLSVEGLFLHVTAMWSVLGAIDEDDRLTPLGWWGLPEAMRRAWTEQLGAGGQWPAVGSAPDSAAAPAPGCSATTSSAITCPATTWPDTGCSSRASSASPVSPGSSGLGPIFLNCLFIDRSRNTSATPMATTTRKPSTPACTSSVGGLLAALTAAINVTESHTPGCRRRGRLLAVRCLPATWLDDSPRSARRRAGPRPGRRTMSCPARSG